MANRRRAPVLLELIKRDRPSLESPTAAHTPAPLIDAPPPRHLQSGPVSAPHSSTPPRAPALHRTSLASTSEPTDNAGAGSLFGPGRAVRVPMGYLFFVAAGILIIFVIGWALGHRSAERRQNALLAEEAARGLGASRDPYLDPQQPVQPSISRSPGQSSPAPAMGASPNSGAPRPGPVAAPTGDPRSSGQNYLVVARADRQNADAVAAFLRQSGLEAVTVPDDNPRFHLVVLAQGFPSGELGSAEAKRLENEAKRLGRIWKRDHRGYTDFSDAYFKLQK